MRVSKAKKQADAVRSLIFSYSFFSRALENKDSDWRIWHDIAKEDKKKLEDLGIKVELHALT